MQVRGCGAWAAGGCCVRSRRPRVQAPGRWEPFLPTAEKKKLKYYNTYTLSKIRIRSVQCVFHLYNIYTLPIIRPLQYVYALCNTCAGAVPGLLVGVVRAVAALVC